MARVGIVLSGCGVFDGAEIHESVLTMLYLEKGGAEIACFAPDKPQLHVIDHVAQEPVDGESRNVLVESARIARGNISKLSSLNVDQFDAVVFPGGFGAVKNLCTYGVDGADCDIDPEAARVIKEAHAKGKVIGGLCIAPVAIARALKEEEVKPVLTIGTDAATAGDLRTLGAENQPASVTEIVVDERNKIVSTPAYMLGPGVSDVAQGIEKLCNKVLEMVS